LDASERFIRVQQGVDIWVREWEEAQADLERAVGAQSVAEGQYDRLYQAALSSSSRGSDSPVVAAAWQQLQAARQQVVQHQARVNDVCRRILKSDPLAFWEF
jgi:hypothetical protein